MKTLRDRKGPKPQPSPAQNKKALSYGPVQPYPILSPRAVPAGVSCALPCHLVEARKDTALKGEPGPQGELSLQNLHLHFCTGRWHLALRSSATVRTRAGPSGHSLHLSSTAQGQVARNGAPRSTCLSHGPHPQCPTERLKDCPSSTQNTEIRARLLAQDEALIPGA